MLGDDVLGHVLSFLPAAEAARVATLSRRWRHIFAAVHTISFTAVRSRLFVNAVSAALYGRHRGAHTTGAPLRGLRVAFDEFEAADIALVTCSGLVALCELRNRGGLGNCHRLSSGTESSSLEDPSCVPSEKQWWTVTLMKRSPTCRVRGVVGSDEHCLVVPGEVASAVMGWLRDVDEPIVVIGDGERAAVDGWLSYAALQAVGELNIDLRLGHEPICGRAYTLRRRGDPTPDLPHASDGHVLYKYDVPRSLFTCAALRSLRLGSCWLDPPAAIALPSLDTLQLSGVTGLTGAEHVQRLVAACPRLADLTLEACARPPRP
ncbi:hypothetical protein C2845_PM05G18330 [Panicum miliaceum]|uniref:F-box domain-containing protein n=1 Tax=Panicum miliaceum TaxID=4540 RepID=A0A3L6T5S1_PANMI|nr:hypothetical protein C2845_PM05G18330 [Panicum miliaceum]